MSKNVPDLLKELRSRLGLTQQAFARKLETSLPTIHRWETGKVHPDARASRAIEQLLLELGPDYRDLHERFMSGDGGKEKLDTRSMEGLLWRAACSIRGEKDAPKFKDYILPLIFIKRLSDVFEDEVAQHARTLGGEAKALEVIERDRSIVRFYIPEEARWPVVSGRKRFSWPTGYRPKTLGEQLTGTVRAIARSNASLQGVIDLVDYNAAPHGERELSDDALGRLIELLSDPRYRMGLDDVEPDFLGRAYEYLLRKFAEGQGQSAGEFFTPKEVGRLMAYLVEPEQGEEVYDPCCGSGGLLIKCRLALKEREKKIDRPLRLFGQEQTGSSFAIARMNMVVHDMEGEIVRGNTMANPKFLDGPRLRRFDVVVTNPMWNQDNFEPSFYEGDPLERFAVRGGFAPGSSADWGWIQHVHASLKKEGRAAIVLDTGAASRGSGNQNENREKAIRRWFVEQDLVDSVILLPDNLFYNTNAAGIILVLRAGKRAERKGKVLLINASAEFKKGRPKNEIPEESIRKIADAFHAGKDVKGFAKAASLEEIAKSDFNLSPSRYVGAAAPVEHRDVQEILNDLSKLDAEARALDGQLKGIFTQLGYRWGGDPGPNDPKSPIHQNRDQILQVAAKHGARNVRLFGSVARGEEGPESDVDFLVEMERGRSLLDHADLVLELQSLLGRPVDVVTENGVYWLLRRRILKEAVPL